MLKQTLGLLIKALIIGVVLHVGIDYSAGVTARPTIEAGSVQQIHSAASSFGR